MSDLSLQVRLENALYVHRGVDYDTFESFYLIVDHNGRIYSTLIENYLDPPVDFDQFDGSGEDYLLTNLLIKWSHSSPVKLKWVPKSKDISNSLVFSVKSYGDFWEKLSFYARAKKVKEINISSFSRHESVDQETGIFKSYVYRVILDTR